MGCDVIPRARWTSERLCHAVVWLFSLRIWACSNTSHTADTGEKRRALAFTLDPALESSQAAKEPSILTWRHVLLHLLVFSAKLCLPHAWRSEQGAHSGLTSLEVHDGESHEEHEGEGQKHVQQHNSSLGRQG